MVRARLGRNRPRRFGGLACRLQKRILDSHQNARGRIRATRNSVHIHGLAGKNALDNGTRIVEVRFVVTFGNHGNRAYLAADDGHLHRDNALVAASRPGVGTVAQRADVHAEIRFDNRVVGRLLFRRGFGSLQLAGLGLRHMRDGIGVIHQRLVRRNGECNCRTGKHRGGHQHRRLHAFLGAGVLAFFWFAHKGNLFNKADGEEENPPSPSGVLVIYG